ncbi:Casparian strip membrane protein [Dioscorea alata]|uniref:Casparian strip membrane protein n=1 Tax=Dioscorea alata TaxID=55571 RepID=A0ACB7VHR8_DIOAL|nr:Casparian strip membrane protein [Dioscorea alata]
MGVENNSDNNDNNMKAWMAKGEEIIRISALIACVVATLVMGLNKESKSIVVAVVANTSISQTLTAKFQDTPAFIYFVIANGIASLYNLSVLSVRFFSKRRGFDITVHLLDLVILVIVDGAVASASSMAELGKNGNMAARWSPICNNFSGFCTHGGFAIAASFVGALLLLILTMLSTINAHIAHPSKPQVILP